ncbi:hypothetical protein [Vibrio barjaei]|uniref:hypothetical protein n=1 Tax=Vibrio barjaei TaxID=1676683 RepID=UPI002283C2CD|nr:hypothetical protein [Vibrio barjaei]MCY9874793.1 hypothetical protein [Vibrio barjaei]
MANRVLPPISSKSDIQEENTHMTFLGIPVLAGIQASYVQLDSEWAITAAHNKIILNSVWDPIYHPSCDVALFRTKHKPDIETVQIARFFQNDEIEATGYAFVLGLTKTKGQYLFDSTFTNWPNCQFSVADFGMGSGISGGGVWKEDQLIGVVTGMYFGSFTNIDQEQPFWPSAFVPLYYLDEWILEVTGRDYRVTYEEKEVSDGQ